MYRRARNKVLAVEPLEAAKTRGEWDPKGTEILDQFLPLSQPLFCVLCGTLNAGVAGLICWVAGCPIKAGVNMNLSEI